LSRNKKQTTRQVFRILPAGFSYEEKGLFLQTLHPVAIFAHLGTLLFLTLLLNNPLYLAGLLVPTGLAIWAADGLPAWETYTKAGLVMAVPVVAVNALFVSAGNTVIWTGPLLPAIGRLRVTLEAISFGAAMSLRLLELISIFCLFNLVVHPDKFLNLLARFASRSALVVSLAVKMLPAMAARLENIKSVQQMRGVDFQNGPGRERIKRYSSLINILILSSLEDSLETAESMQARAYGSGPRSCYDRSVWRPRDALCLAGTTLALGIGTGGYFSGLGSYRYYPQLDPLVNGPVTLIPLFLLLLCLCVPAILSWGWHSCPYIKSKI
jgi:energy-coupling factor transport system permease protein